MCLLVRIQVRIRTEPLLTLIALVRLLTGVRANVPLQGGRHDKRFWAIVTLELLLPGVDFHMVPERARLGQNLPAHVALILLGQGIRRQVNFHMIVEIVERDERFIARIALERFLGHVRRSMNFERRFGLADEKANLTGKGGSLHAPKAVDQLQPFVALFMLVQIVALDESLLAEGTLVALLARVNAHMPLKVLIAFERLRAHITHKGCLGAVAQLVPIQIADDEKTLRTLVAFEGLAALLVGLGVL